ncbi:hypothetical protein BLOT_002972 [Blomia tropicalis]|nr:hypothetical protein BLOT_002972 [Blomia tropicalis]
MGNKSTDSWMSAKTTATTTTTVLASIKPINLEQTWGQAQVSTIGKRLWSQSDRHLSSLFSFGYTILSSSWDRELFKKHKVPVA